jgi:hypothetical protein
VNQANRGDYEQHLRAVKELSKLAVSDSEFCQLAQVLGFNTCAEFTLGKMILFSSA